jgi:hypothetical protein
LLKSKEWSPRPSFAGLLQKENLMNRIVMTVGACVTLVLITYALVVACGDYGSLTNHWAQRALAENKDVAAQAIERLRSQGATGLDALIEEHANLLDEAARPADEQQQSAWKAARARLFAAMDEVSGQRDCRASRLFWHTDLEKAKAAAKAQGKPILSLRMMGRLTDEFSCANSRFFRTTLYANADVSKTLREKFVLHWESVRPVPKVSIDFGDGRKLERTLTGNSAHYVLDKDGRVIDALPGLYSAKAFLRILASAESAFHDSNKISDGDRDEFFVRYYNDRKSEIESNWASDLRRVGVELASAQPQQQAPAQPAAAAPNAAPPARAAAALAVSKRVVEMPIINAVAAQPRVPSADELKSATVEEFWPKIAALHFAEAELDAASRALIASKNPTAARAAPLAVSKVAVESPLVRMFRNLQQSIAVDTVRNEYLFRRQILEWLASGGTQAAGDVYALNERVYAELFLTPRNDPWLGLLPADTYSALDNDGVAVVER